MGLDLLGLMSSSSRQYLARDEHLVPVAEWLYLSAIGILIVSIVSAKGTSQPLWSL